MGSEDNEDVESFCGSDGDSVGDDVMIIFEESPLGKYLKNAVPDLASMLEPRSLEEEVCDAEDDGGNFSGARLEHSGHCPLQHDSYFLLGVIRELLHNADDDIQATPLTLSVSKPSLVARVWKYWTFSRVSLSVCRQWNQSVEDFVMVANRTLTFLFDHTHTSLTRKSEEKDELSSVINCVALRLCFSRCLIEVNQCLEKFNDDHSFCDLCCPQRIKISPITSTVDLQKLKKTYSSVKGSVADVLQWFLSALLTCCGRVSLLDVKLMILSKLRPLTEVLARRSRKLERVLSFHKFLLCARNSKAIEPALQLLPESPLLLCEFRVAAVVRRVMAAVLANDKLHFSIASNELRRELHSARIALDFFLKPEDPDDVAPQQEASQNLPEAKLPDVGLIEERREVVDEIFSGEGLKLELAHRADLSDDCVADSDVRLKSDRLLLKELRPKLRKLRDEWENREKKVVIDGIADEVNEVGIRRSRRPGDIPSSAFANSDAEDSGEPSRKGPNPIHFEAIAQQMASFAPFLEGIVARMNESVFCDDVDGD